MTYYGAKELAASFRTVRKNTIQIAEDIPESQYDFKAAPDTRSVAQMLVHIALATSFASHIHGDGNKIQDLSKMNFQELIQKLTAEEAKPRTKAEIVAFLKAEGEKFASFLETLPEPFLGERLTMMPGSEPASRTRFDMLLSAKEHEMHHRAQLMLIERMIGIVPHLTRVMQERMARMQAASQPAR
jgi:uncharacterized damage-inducible protein DinB